MERRSNVKKKEEKWERGKGEWEASKEAEKRKRRVRNENEEERVEKTEIKVTKEENWGGLRIGTCVNKMQL